MAPDAPKSLPGNVRFIQKETSGLGTLLFCCLGVLFYCLKFRATHCLSFNNVNLIIPVCKRITYFHQAKVFTERTLRFRIMAMAIRFLRGSTIILQSPLIQELFARHFSDNYNLLVKWPGITPENAPEEPISFPLQDDKVNVLWPVTDPYVPQKNLDWITEHQQWFIQNNIHLLIPSSSKVDLPFVTSLGGMPRANLFELYKKVQGVLVVSTEETLCLPIFEAASQGAKVWVLRRPYIEAIQNWREVPPDVHIFDQPKEISLECLKQQSQTHFDSNYYQADWQIY